MRKSVYTVPLGILDWIWKLLLECELLPEILQAPGQPCQETAVPASAPRWWCRKSLNLPPPTCTPNLCIHIEQFFPKKNWELIEQLLHNKGQRHHRQKSRRDGDTVAVGTPPLMLGTEGPHHIFTHPGVQFKGHLNTSAGSPFTNTIVSTKWWRNSRHSLCDWKYWDYQCLQSPSTLIVWTGTGPRHTIQPAASAHLGPLAHTSSRYSPKVVFLLMPKCSCLSSSNPTKVAPVQCVLVHPHLMFALTPSIQPWYPMQSTPWSPAHTTSALAILPGWPQFRVPRNSQPVPPTAPVRHWSKPKGTHSLQRRHFYTSPLLED